MQHFDIFFLVDFFGSILIFFFKDCTKTFILITTIFGTPLNFVLKASASLLPALMLPGKPEVLLPPC